MQLLRQLETVAEPDVLVVGAGCAGTTAAIAAARRGARTMVVERCGFAGGYITAVVGPALDGFVDLRSGLPVVGGLVLELARKAARTSAAGDLASTRFHFNVEIGQMRGAEHRVPIRFDVERFKLEADRAMRAAGVRVLYHTVVADVERRGDQVTAVVLANKKGLTAVKPRCVVDASGDADVAAFAGAPFDLGPDPLQPMSLHFRAGPLTPGAALRRRCGEVLVEAHREGRLGLYAGPWMSEVEANDLYFNATRISGNPLDPDDLSRAEMQGREDARLMFELFKENIPEFKDACFTASGPMVGVRESRRIRAAATLRLADIEQQRGCDDVVCLGAWWLDRHPQDSSGYHAHTMVRPYDISYGTLVPRELANVWVAGRCHGAEPAALASSRVTVTCMGMGQAAGTAAALAVAAGCDAPEVDAGRLQADLVADGAIILERADAVRKVGDELAVEESGWASR